MSLYPAAEIRVYTPVGLNLVARCSALRAFCSWRAHICVTWSLQACCQSRTTSTYAAGHQPLVLYPQH